MKIIICYFLLTFFCKFAFSDEQQIIAMGDIEYGEYLGAECVSCHQQKGASEGIPAIHGMDGGFRCINACLQSKRDGESCYENDRGRLNDEQIGS